jgi:hypothetical protein
MKNQENLFPADKCYIFDQLKHCYSARYERVRIPSTEELMKMWKDKKSLYAILFCFNPNIFNLLRGVV